MGFFIGTWINSWVNNGETGDLRCHRTPYDVTVLANLINAELSPIKYMETISIQLLRSDNLK